MVDEGTRAVLIEKHLNVLRHRHKDNQDWWRALDTKAQGNVVGCGILLAGTFATMSGILTNSDSALRLLLRLTLGSLLGSVAFSVSAVLMRKTKTPPPPLI